MDQNELSHRERFGARCQFVYQQVGPSVVRLMADPTLVVDLTECRDTNARGLKLRIAIGDHFDIPYQSFGFMPLKDNLLAHLLTADEK